MMDELATKDDLHRAVSELRTHLATKAELKAEISELRVELKAEMSELRADMSAMEERLTKHVSQEISRALAASAERFETWFGGLDDKYKGLPPRVTTLERVMEDHVNDDDAHKPPRKPRRRG